MRGQSFRVLYANHRTSVGQHRGSIAKWPGNEQLGPVSLVLFDAPPYNSNNNGTDRASLTRSK